MRIGMFDSGVGGLTVLKEFIKRIPSNEYIYFGDTKRVPYGNKAPETIIKYAKEIIDFLINEKVDIIIVACNSVSAVAFEKIKTEYKIPIYDVITPTVEYIQKKGYNNIGVIGTKATINSRIYEKCLTGLKVISKACPLFVPIVEENLEDNIIVDNTIDYYLSSFKNTKIEALVLGCTHYPILETNIAKYLKTDIINPAVLLAEKIKKETNSDSKEKTKYTFYFSEINSNVKELVNSILGININEFLKHEF